jgi:hypothetical protein
MSNVISFTGVAGARAGSLLMAHPAGTPVAYAHPAFTAAWVPASAAMAAKRRPTAATVKSVDRSPV